MTNKLEPCQCGVVLALVGEAHYHPVMPVSQCFFRGKWIEVADREQWNTLMSTTSARKEGARLGIEAAAKKVLPVLLGYQLSNMVFDDGSDDPYRLVDLLTPGENVPIDAGIAEAELIASEITDALRSINIDDLVKHD